MGKSEFNDTVTIYRL